VNNINTLNKVSINRLHLKLLRPFESIRRVTVAADLEEVEKPCSGSDNMKDLEMHSQNPKDLIPYKHTLSITLLLQTSPECALLPLAVPLWSLARHGNLPLSAAAPHV
jgi:hypothetical protein